MDLAVLLVNELAEAQPAPAGICERKNSQTFHLNDSVRPLALLYAVFALLVHVFVLLGLNVRARRVFVQEIDGMVE